MATNNQFYPFGYGFHNNSGDSIDDRLVLTKAQMKVAHELSSGLCMPDKYFCLCSEDNNLYTFDSTNTVDETTGKFRILSSGGTLDEYIKSAAIDGNKLTLKKKDDTTVVYETKTVNSQSLVGTGNVVVQPVSSHYDKSEEASTALSSLTDNGVYKIAHASDKPTNTSESGTLSVNKLAGTKLEQTWYSDTNYAYRVLDTEGPAPEVGFYVNDVLQTPDEDGNVYISVTTSTGTEADLVKHLRGTLDGQVIILNTAGVKRFVTLVLDGVTINTAGTSAIYCNNSTTETDDETRICLEVSENKINTLTSTATATAVSSYGCIHCESDMYVSGTGFLNITCANGHGIKAKDMIISGKPHITIDAKHDGIHGKSLHVAGGYYYFKNANDVFSAGSDNNSGVLKVSGGSIEVEKCSENVFQAKRADDPYTTITTKPTDWSTNWSSYYRRAKGTTEAWVSCADSTWDTTTYDYASLSVGRILIYYDTEVILHDNFSSNPVCDAGTGGNIIVYPTVTCKNVSGTALTNLDTWRKTVAQLYGTGVPTITCSQSATGTIEAVNNVFTLPYGDITYNLKGDFSNYKIVVQQPKAVLNLYGVYYNNQTDDTGTFIDYVYNTGDESEWKNVKITLLEDTEQGVGAVTYFAKKYGTIIKSTRNVNINNGGTGYGDLYLSCTNGYCIDAANEVRIQNDGARYFVNSKYGIKSNLINCGDELAAEDYTKCKTSMIYCCGNSDYDIGLFKGTYSSVERNGRVNVCANTFGTAYLGKVKKLVASETIEINAEVHAVVRDTETFIRHPFVYVYEDSDAYTDVNNNVVEIDPNSTGEETVSSWKVYAAGGDCYTKSQSDERYTLQATYAAKIASLESTIAALTLRVEALEGTALNPSFDDATGSLTLSHTSISDEGAVNLNRSEIDDNGNVTLK